MKVLLDKNMPGWRQVHWVHTAGGLLALLLLAIVVGTWFGGKTLLTNEQRNVAGTIKTVNNKNVPSVASTEKIVEQGGASSTSNETGGGTTKPNNNLPGAAYASSNSTADNNTPVTNDQPSATGNTPVLKMIL